MKHNRLQSGGINPIFRTYELAKAYLNDPAAWEKGYKALHVARHIYQPWRDDGGLLAYEVVMVRDRAVSAKGRISKF